MSSTPGRHHCLPRPTSRTLVLLLLAVIVSAGTVIDQRVKTPVTPNVTPPVGAAPASAVSSAWYCPLLTNAPNGTSASAVNVFNPQSQALAGEVTFVDNMGNQSTAPVNVAPRSRQVFNPSATLGGSYVSALVRLTGGGASVEQFAHTTTGNSSTPCTSTASRKWYFADGSTESGASLQIGVFNPFTESAIVDASFSTSDRSRREGGLHSGEGCFRASFFR